VNVVKESLQRICKFIGLPDENFITFYNGSLNILRGNYRSTVVSIFKIITDLVSIFTDLPVGSIKRTTGNISSTNHVDSYAKKYLLYFVLLRTSTNVPERCYHI
jgi:hypothetical protein